MTKKGGLSFKTASRTMKAQMLLHGVAPEASMGIVKEMAGNARLGTSAATSALVGQGMSLSSVKRINFGTKLRGYGRIIGFAPLAFMAFDMVANALTIAPPVRAPAPMRTTSLGGTFYDTGLAYTQRRRALESIHNSQYGGRSAFGNEASILHN